ncbi:acyl-CoA/acyl-ACP dehydrogenase [Aquabacterium sp. A7-Y]|uniref:acyl-CoA dehydrogenase family protein n=1 Tax=Aquabacterium sp. A7-Y TaxID=1349605 RepID=UPI00223D21F4|nr:acyl-CoA dehydrogenase family protein [Aquabacterium sp. A7-Y]MCW7541717.1 acyl-CoA/acyl-ACP dehydrogenase [Aquabacterium sp. A7-Y]
MDEFLPSELQALLATARAVAEETLLPEADSVDRDCLWPAAGLQALAATGLAGLTVPSRLGGLGQRLLGLVALTEVLGQSCASTAMCYAMHCVATAVIAAKATRFHEEHYLRPIAAGRHLTTLALSETGTGAHFFLPQTRLEPRGDSFAVNGTKQFVTNGGQADSYVVSTTAGSETAEGDFSCVVVDRDTPGMSWGAPWRGLGMRGNASRSLTLENVVLPRHHLLGREGDQAWYVFEVITPYFALAMAGTYLGVAGAALEAAVQHLKTRRYAHSGQAVAEIEVLQHRIGQLWTGWQKTRLLVYHAARLGDLGDPSALTAILACKADAANTAVTLVNEAMTLCGGMAYRENSTLSRLLRDARAAHVMSPTTDMLTVWTGRTVLGLPLL